MTIYDIYVCRVLLPVLRVQVPSGPGGWTSKQGGICKAVWPGKHPKQGIIIVIGKTSSATVKLFDHIIKLNTNSIDRINIIINKW